MFLGRRGIAMDPSTQRILYLSLIQSLDTCVCRLDAGPRSAQVHEMWQTAFSYFRMIGRAWHSLSSVLDDFSRYTCTIASSASVTRQERCERRKTDIKPPCYI
jgi:hypothetical protein